MVRITGSGIDAAARAAAASAQTTADDAQAIAAAAIPAPAGASDGQALVLQSGVWTGGAVSGSAEDAELNALCDNLALTNYRLQVSAALARYELENGFIDSFQDAEGIASASGIVRGGAGYYTNEGDPFTVMALNFNGDGANFTDETGNVLSVVGNATQTDAGAKVGAKCGLFTGGGLSTPGQAKFEGLVNGDFEVDGFYYITAFGNLNDAYLFSYGVDSPNRLYLEIYPSGAGVRWSMVGLIGGVPLFNMTSNELPTGMNAWHHLHVAKCGTTLKIYLDGTDVTDDAQTIDTTTFPNFTGAALYVGTLMGWGNYLFTGKLDRLHIRKGIGTVGAITEPTLDITYNPTPGPFILQSTAFMAPEAYGTVRVLALIDPIDAVTLNTDLKGWVSLDNGVTWAEAPLALVGAVDTLRNIIACTVDVSAQSGTELVVKLTGHNNKALRIYSWACTGKV